MDNLNKVRVPDIQFNNLGGFDHGLPTYVFPNQTKLHTGNMRPAKSPPKGSSCPPSCLEGYDGMPACQGFYCLNECPGCGPAGAWKDGRQQEGHLPTCSACLAQYGPSKCCRTEWCKHNSRCDALGAHTPPHTTNFWTQLKEWLSKPLNLSLVLCIIALLIVILF